MDALVLPRPLFHKVVTYVDSATLLQLSAASKACHALAEQLWPVVFARERTGAWRCRKRCAGSWKERFWGSWPMDNLADQLDSVGAGDVVLLCPGEYNLGDVFLGQKPVTIEGVGYNRDFRTLLNMDARSADAIMLPTHPPNVVLLANITLENKPARKRAVVQRPTLATSLLLKNLTIVNREDLEYGAVHVGAGCGVSLENVECLSHGLHALQMQDDALCHARFSFFRSWRADGFNSRAATNEVVLTSCLAMRCQYAGVSVCDNATLDGCIMALNGSSGLSCYSNETSVDPNTTALTLRNCLLLDNVVTGLNFCSDSALVLQHVRSSGNYYGWFSTKDLGRFTQDALALSGNVVAAMVSNEQLHTCTVLSLGARYVQQKSYECITCGISGTFLDLCGPCAQHHELEGHQVNLRAEDLCICDCFFISTCPFRKDHLRRLALAKIQ